MFTDNKTKEELKRFANHIKSKEPRAKELAEFLANNEKFMSFSDEDKQTILIHLLENDNIPLDSVSFSDFNDIKREMCSDEVSSYLEKNIKDFDKLAQMEQEQIVEHVVNSFVEIPTKDKLLKILKNSKISVNVRDNGYSASVIINDTNDDENGKEECSCCCKCDSDEEEPVTEAPKKKWATDEQMKKSFDIKVCCRDVLKILKNNNGILDRTVLIRKLNHYYRKEGILRYDGTKTILSDENKRKEVIAHVLKVAESHVVLQWRNLVMTRKGYNRLCTMFTEFTLNATAKSLGVELKKCDTITFPKMWDGPLPY